MRFKLPFTDNVTVRICERVETVDPQYDIVDCGFEYASGRIDSLAVGGSFSTLKSWTSPDDDKAVSAQNADIAVAQATNGVPVTDPVISKESKGDTPS